jgi:Zn-dependent peptidase ImmA (M78 family)
MAVRSEVEATNLIKRVWPGGSGNLPIDPVYIAQKLGIRVYTANLDEGVAGLLVKGAGQDPEIYLSREDSQNRQRFTCAHELGHYVSRSTDDTRSWAYIDRRDELASRGTNKDEIYANDFAASLLMPRTEVLRLHAAGLNPASLAVTFKVSLEAINNRLSKLRLA